MSQIFCSFYSASFEIFGVQVVTDRQTKFWPSICGNGWVFFPDEICYLLTRFTCRVILSLIFTDEILKFEKTFQNQILEAQYPNVSSTYAASFKTRTLKTLVVEIIPFLLDLSGFLSLDMHTLLIKKHGKLQRKGWNNSNHLLAKLHCLLTNVKCFVSVKVVKQVVLGIENRSTVHVLRHPKQTSNVFVIC